MKLFCRHKRLEFVRNIYGDEINSVSVSRVYRSWWECLDCGRLIPKPQLGWSWKRRTRAVTDESMAR